MSRHTSSAEFEMTLKFQMSPDNKNLTIAIHEDERRLGYVVASAGEVEKLIQTLASFRRKMAPEVPRTFKDGCHPAGEVDPIWAIRTHPAALDKVVTIRHFGIGWLSFLLPAESARLLGRT